LDDLRLLIRPETKRRKIDLQWANEIGNEVPLPSLPVRDAVLNLLLNACAASPESGRVTFLARIQDSHLTIEITDQGPGLPQAVRDYLEKPHVGSAPIDQRGGLGLWMVKRLAMENGGELRASPNGDTGTIVSFTIRLGQKELKNVA
jgi:signal transduction histidine kinase